MSKVLPLAALALVVGFVQSPAAEPRAGMGGEVQTRRVRRTWLFVETRPSGATIELDDQPLGVSDDLFEVSPGLHTVTVQRDGYQPQQQPVEIPEKRVTRLVVELQRPSYMASSGLPPVPMAAPAGPLVVQPIPRYTVLSLPWGSGPPAEEPPADAILQGHEGQVNWVEFSPSGRILASAGADTTVRLWSVPSGRPRHVLTVHDSRLGVYSVAFSPDGKILASCSGNGVQLWDPETGRLLSSKGDLRQAQSLVFSPDGKTLAVGTGANSVMLCDTQSLEVQSILRDLPTEDVLLGHDNSVRRIAWSRDDKLLACAGGWHPQVPGRLTIWDTSTSRLLSSFEVADGCVRAVAFSPDGKLLAYAADDTVKLVEMAKLPRATASR